MKFMKPCRTDIKIPFAFQKDVHTYAANLIYGVKLQFIVGDRLAKKSSNTLLYCSEKNLRKSVSCQMDTVEKKAWILIFLYSQSS